MNRKNCPIKLRPERIIQFGEGHFLRAFVDYIVQKMNDQTDFNGNVVVVKPRSTKNEVLHHLNEQDGLFYLHMQGLNQGELVDELQLVDVISRGINPYDQHDAYLKLAENPETRFVVSNTTEAGLVFDPDCKLNDLPASSYPGKLTQLLYHRFRFFEGDPTKGLLIFPCELIFKNGEVLKNCIHQYIRYWNLEATFLKWFDTACGVYSTLVDRIVTGNTKAVAEQLTKSSLLDDKLWVNSETFLLWVLEAPAWVAQEFPVDKTGLDVHFVADERPYHQRKVTLLNGPHTVLAPVGYLSGVNIVRECLEDEAINRFLRMVLFEELMPTLDLQHNELITFAQTVLDRFGNPYINHELTGILMNSFPKYKTRDLPGLKIYLDRKGVLPRGLVLGLAAICTYYKGGLRGEDRILPNDDPKITGYLNDLWATTSTRSVAEGVLAATFIWGENLNDVPGLTDCLIEDLDSIQERGMYETLQNRTNKEV